MFPAAYFGPRYYPGPYFPKVGSAAVAPVPEAGFILFAEPSGFLLADNPCGFDAGPPNNGLNLTD
jgi:hypothetical protein